MKSTDDLKVSLFWCINRWLPKLVQIRRITEYSPCYSLLDRLRYLFATSLAFLDFPCAYRTASLPIP